MSQLAEELASSQNIENKRITECQRLSDLNAELNSQVIDNNEQFNVWRKERFRLLKLCFIHDRIDAVLPRLSESRVHLDNLEIFDTFVSFVDAGRSISCAVD